MQPPSPLQSLRLYAHGKILESKYSKRDISISIFNYDAPGLRMRRQVSTIKWPIKWPILYSCQYVIAHANVNSNVKCKRSQFYSFAKCLCSWRGTERAWLSPSQLFYKLDKAKIRTNIYHTSNCIPLTLGYGENGLEKHLLYHSSNEYSCIT